MLGNKLEIPNIQTQRMFIFHFLPCPSIPVLLPGFQDLRDSRLLCIEHGEGTESERAAVGIWEHTCEVCRSPCTHSLLAGAPTEPHTPVGVGRRL